MAEKEPVPENQKPFDPNKTDEFIIPQIKEEPKEGVLGVLEKGKKSDGLVYVNNKLQQLKTERRLLQKELRESYERSEEAINADLERTEKEIGEAKEEKELLEDAVKKAMVDYAHKKRLKEKEATMDLAGLDLDWEDLSGKLILDVGAGASRIAEVGEEKDIQIVSLEKDPDAWKEMGGKIPGHVPYVVADSTKLPLGNESFDVVISHGGPPLVLTSKKEVIDTVQEIKRVLKEGGEARLGFSAFDYEILGEEPLKNAESPEQFEERVKKSLELLKSIHENIEVKETPKESRSGMAGVKNYFYILKK